MNYDQSTFQRDPTLDVNDLSMYLSILTVLAYLHLT